MRLERLVIHRARSVYCGMWRRSSLRPAPFFLIFSTIVHCALLLTVSDFTPNPKHILETDKVASFA